MSTFSANGDYISGSVTINDPNTSVAVVRAELESTRDKANDVLDMLIGPSGNGGLLGDLTAGISSIPSTTVVAPTVDTSIALVASGAAVPQFNYGALEPYPVKSYAAPTLDPLPTVNTNFSTVIEPGDPIFSLTWAEAVLPTEVFLALKTKILADMSGGTGLDAAVEDAIYNRARHRQQVDRLAEWNRINNTAAEMQFAFPSGVLSGALVVFGVGAARADADIENQIVVAQAELAQKNVHHALSQASALEQLIRQTRDGESSRALDAAKTLAQLAVQEFSERVKRYMAIWEGRKTEVQAQVEVLRGVIESNKGLIAQFEAEVSSFKTEVDATVAQNKGLVEVFTGEVQGFGEVERAVSARNASSIQLLAEKIKNADLDLRGQIAGVTAAVEAFAAEQNIKERIATAVANIASQVAASLLSAVHTSLGASYNASESASKGYSVSVGLSEQHEVPHDPSS